MATMMTLTPPWQGLATIVEGNTRDLIARRFTLGTEVASWFKSLALFREAEAVRLMESEPTPDDLHWHRAILATLIADGERLLLEWDGSDIERTPDRIARADLAAAVTGLYSSQSTWHGDTSPEQRRAIIQRVFGVDPEKLRFERAA
jgi:hypothetical protein